MKEIPVYLFLGFLESGKSSFIQETMSDSEFHFGESTLMLQFEEGIEEINTDKFHGGNVHVINVEDKESLSEKWLRDQANKIDAQRIVLEYNGMWDIDFLASIFPKEWILYQIIMTADSTNFASYMQNIRQLTVDKMQLAQTIVFNRVDENTDRAFLHKCVRSVNRRANIIFEFTDGSIADDNIVDELPYDINKDVIELADEDFGLFFIDAMETPEKYKGKTIHFKALACITNRLAKNCFAIGRFAMTCCEDDIAFLGLICDANKHQMPQHRTWVDITATISVKNHEIYEGKGPWLKLQSITQNAEKPKEELIQFI